MRRHLNIASFYQADSFVRIDKPTLPVLAVREALINAICHRNYQSSAAITLAIFDDRLEIWNTGFLPKELGIEDLKKKHGSFPRNKLIADTFYKRGLIEGWGTGTLKMTERCLEYGLLEPQFYEYSNGLAVKFIFAEPIGPLRTKTKISKLINPNERIKKRQEEIIAILERFNELTSAEIKAQLSFPIAARTLRDDLIALKRRGVINSRGRSNNAVWFKNKN